MSVVEGVGYDAARLTLVTLAVAGRENPKVCRRLRRATVDALQMVPAMPAVREEAIRGMKRACGACGMCRGI